MSRDLLTDVYRCLLTDSCPGHSAEEVSRAVLSAVRGLSAPPAAEQRGRGGVSEGGLTALTLLENMHHLLHLPRGDTPAAPGTHFCVTCVELLFQRMDLMTPLVHLFRAEDQILSHLAAKTVSLYVTHDLLQSGTVNCVWQQTCEGVFLGSISGPELDVCLWSLTEVLKTLLKSPAPDSCEKLVAVFDSSVSALCSAFLSEVEEQCFSISSSSISSISSSSISSSRQRATTFCLLLDLLEALAASGRLCGFSLRSQRLVHTCGSSLLSIISSSSSEYFVKKRTLLLLKRVVLQKPGEEWTSVSALQPERGDPDVSALAQSLLTTGSAHWLEKVEVRSPAFFGGNKPIRGDPGQRDPGQRADFVVLRAVSLLLLKSLEIHCQPVEQEASAASAASAAAASASASEVCESLQRLWSFLSVHCGVCPGEPAHSCRWVSAVFGEQDDDLMEASRSLLSIFLQLRPSSGLEASVDLDPSDLDRSACGRGLNPHCHFLQLLRGVSFDHRVLLDFLISAETCFLEYLLRYLKYLRTDWTGFTAAGQRVTAESGRGSADRTGPLRLVDYDSTDESDPENMEVPEQSGSRDPAGFLTEAPPTEDRGSEGPGLDRTLKRAVSCLSRLRDLVQRLQTKNLFPYNPSSLLKILDQVLNCSP